MKLFLKFISAFIFIFVCAVIIMYTLQRTTFSKEDVFNCAASALGISIITLLRK